MGIMNWTMWSMVIGMSFISIGGLLFWVYGDSLRIRAQQSGMGIRKQPSFTGVIIYSAVMILLGIGFMANGTFAMLTGNISG